MPEATTIHDAATAISALKDNVNDVQFTMLTTRGPGGELHTRPMATHDMDPDGTLWFFTYADSQKALDITGDPHVGLGYAEPKDNLWVSVSGTAEVVRDPAKIHQLWKAPLKVFFPDGPEDPNVALLRVTPIKGEIWDGPSTAVGRAVAFARTYASDATTPPGDDVKLEFPGR